MIAASAIGLFVIPMLYVTFQTIRERSSARFACGRPVDTIGCRARLAGITDRET